MKLKSKYMRVAAGIMCAALAVNAVPMVHQISDVSGADIIMGDVNSDGRIDSYDLVALRKLSTSSETVYTSAHAAGDVNGNGSIDKEDLQILSDYILGKNVEFAATYEPPTEPPTEPPAETMRYYAADAVYQNAWTETSNEGFEGESYVNFNNEIGSFIEWTIEAPSD